MNSLQDLSLADLLADISDTVVRDQSDIEAWVKYEQLQPGTARVAYRELYAAYERWAAQQSGTAGKKMSPNQLAKQLHQIGRRVRGGDGTYYMVCWPLAGRGSPEKKFSEE
jgi:phage/plasmid-associated DNA primase